MKALFLLNPRSGQRRRGDLSDLIRSIWPGAEVLRTERKEDLDGVIDEAERDGYEAVFAVGGDGTVHEIAKRLIHRDLALGVLPTGSGNGFARHIGMPMDLRRALVSLRDARVETIDTAEVDGHRFLAVMGVGFDAEIAHAFATSSVRGLRTYVREGLAAFRSYDPEECDVTVDGEALRRRAFVVAIANSSEYGNRARIAPLASLQDGLLDVVVIDHVTAIHAGVLLTRLFAGTLHHSPHVTFRKAREIVIRRRTAGAAHLDGEPITLGAELRVRVVEKSLKVLVPRTAAKI